MALFSKGNGGNTLTAPAKVASTASACGSAVGNMNWGAECCGLCLTCPLWVFPITPDFLSQYGNPIPWLSVDWAWTGGLVSQPGICLALRTISCESTGIDLPLDEAEDERPCSSLLVDIGHYRSVVCSNHHLAALEY